MMKPMREAPLRPLELAKPFTASAFELGKDLFGKYASADDSSSSERRGHRRVALSAKYERLQRKSSVTEKV